MTPDLFGDANMPNPRDAMLRERMMVCLRAPWGESPPRIAEPSDAEKVAYCEAFVASSQPRNA